jgi:hypothetical protein
LDSLWGFRFRLRIQHKRRAGGISKATAAKKLIPGTKAQTASTLAWLITGSHPSRCRWPVHATKEFVLNRVDAGLEGDRYFGAADPKAAITFTCRRTKSGCQLGLRAFPAV